jgi:hypothetical protein
LRKSELTDASLFCFADAPEGFLIGFFFLKSMKLCGRNVLWELRTGGGVDGIGARETLEIPESVKGLDKFLWVGQDGFTGLC